MRRNTRKVATEGASLSFVLPPTATPPASPMPPSPLPPLDVVNESPSSVNGDERKNENLENEMAFGDDDDEEEDLDDKEE